ncbi:M16 family metallopeptidase [Desulfocastanea catecholica]
MLQIRSWQKYLQKRFCPQFLLLLVICIPVTAFSSTGGPAASCFATAWPADVSDLAPDPSLHRGTLKNGFRYVLKRNNEPAERVAVYLDVQAGSLHEKDNQRGVAHFLEHMLFNGSTHFPPGSLVEYFQSLGMSFGGDTNAFTSHTETVYNIILPSGTEKDLDSALLVMADYARGALLLDSEIDKERGVILAEKRARDSAEYRSQVATSRFAFRGTRYPERMPIGTEETIKSADHELLKSYYDAWYRPENMILILVGDIDLELTTGLIKKHFAALTAAGPKPPCPDFGKLELKGVETFYHYEPELGKTNIAIQNFSDLPLENDSLLLEKSELLKMIGSMAFNYRLQRLQEEAKVPFAEAGYSSGDIARRIGYSSLSAQVDAPNWKQTLTSLEQILRQVIEYGFTESELERAKKELLAQLEARVLKAPSEDSRTIGRRIIDHLNRNRVYQSATEEKDLYGPLVNAVSLADVQEDFRKRWSHDNRLISVTGDVQLGEKGTADIAAIYHSSTQVAVEASVSGSAHVFPYLHPPSAANTLVQQTTLPDIDVEQLVFANGLIVNLKKTQFEESTIRLRADFGGGKQQENMPGMAMLAEEVVNESGSGTLPQSAINALVAGSSITLSFRIGESAFTWAGTTLSKDFELFSQLLYTLLADPGLRENAYNKGKENLELMYQKMNRQIEGAVPLQVQPFLANYNAHIGLPAWEDVTKVNFDALARWSKSFIRPKDLEISVVGDFNRDEVVAVLTKYFSGIELTPPPIPVSPAVHFPVGEKLAVTVNTSDDKSLITVAWPTDDFWDIHKTRRLQLLSSIFGDRLRKIIREKLAASYSPRVSSFNSRIHQGFGYIISQMVVEPGAEDMVIKEIFKISDQLARKGITTEELNRARGPLVTSLMEHTRSNQYWLNTVLALAARYPQQLDWARTIISDYSTISEAEINELAKEYLKNDKAAVARVASEITRSP